MDQQRKEDLINKFVDLIDRLIDEKIQQNSSSMSDYSMNDWDIRREMEDVLEQLIDVDPEKDRMARGVDKWGQPLSQL